MSTFRRSGHWRRGRNGRSHWVSAHSVTRDGRGEFVGRPSSRRRYTEPRATPRVAPQRPVRTRSRPFATPPVTWGYPLDKPNSRCPVCRQPVWFFRNERGGCAYFDAVGKPWPLHPCMEAWKTAEDSWAVHEAIAAYERIMRWTNAQPGAYSYASAGTVRQAEIRNGALRDPGDPWIVLSGFLATLLSLPIALWALTASEGGPVLLLVWMIVVPVLAMSGSLGWLLARVPRRRFGGRSWLGAAALSPLLMIAGIFGNLFTCGVGLPALALFVFVRANAAGKRQRPT